MKKVGEIIAILNDRHLLLRSDKALEPKRVLKIFSNVEDKALAERGLPEKITFPKGDLRIVCDEGGGVYLAEIFQEVRKIRKRVPSAASQGLLGWANPFEQEEVVEEVRGDWSATANAEQSLNMEMSVLVNVGDFVGTLS